MIAAGSVDRLGRSLQHLVELLNELQALQCNLYLHQQAIDTTTPSGKAMFQMCGVFAEFERAMIVERVNSGLARAKAKGVKLGRGNKKDGERSADERRWGMSRAELKKRILRLYKGGTGIVKIGKTLGIGTGLVQRVVTPRPFDVAEPYAFKLRRGAAMRRTSITERTFCTTCHRMCCSGRSMHNFPLHPAMERVKHAFS